jgi:WD40 repeat protein
MEYCQVYLDYFYEKVNADLYIQHLAFSADGTYLASLGSFPTFEITIWDWKSNTKICSTSNIYPAKFVSFNPAESSDICTSGEGKIRFWKLKLGLKTGHLKAV